MTDKKEIFTKELGDEIRSEEYQHTDEGDEGQDILHCEEAREILSVESDVQEIKHPESVCDDSVKFKYGIVYLSSIPDGMNVQILRQVMSQFGEVNRIFLEPEKSNKKHRRYIEGWIEFKKKRVAKSVARSLNGKPLQFGKSKMNGHIWSLKYLHRFKWAHLLEQLAYDRAVRDQRRKFEMSQTKKQVDFYQKMTERSRQKTSKVSSQENNNSKHDDEKMRFRQKQGRENVTSVDKDLLGSIFRKVA